MIPHSTISYSYEVVNDGLWHTVELLTVKQNFTLRIDHGTARFIVNDGPNEYLQTTSPLYIGGLPREVAEAAVKAWHLRETGSFNGNAMDSTTLLAQCCLPLDNN